MLMHAAYLLLIVWHEVKTAAGSDMPHFIQFLDFDKMELIVET